MESKSDLHTISQIRKTTSDKYSTSTGRLHFNTSYKVHRKQREYLQNEVKLTTKKVNLNRSLLHKWLTPSQNIPTNNQLRRRYQKQ